MSDLNLWNDTKAVLIPQITFAISAWWGFVGVAHKNRLQSIVKKAKRYGFLPPLYDNLEDLTLSSDEKLFHSVRYNPYHVLHYYPLLKILSLRERSHNLSLGHLTA